MSRGLLQKHADLFAMMFRLTDLAVIILGGLAAYWLRFGDLHLDSQYQFAIAVAAPMALLVFPAFGLYQPWRGVALWQEIRQTAAAWTLLMAGCVVLAFLTKTGTLYSRIWFGSWVLIALLALIGGRVLLRTTLRCLRAQGHNIRRVVILGAGELGRKVAQTLKEQAWAGLHVIGFLDDDPELQGSRVDGLTVLGTLDDAGRLVDRTSVFESENDDSGQREQLYADQAWIALPLSAEACIRKAVSALNSSSVSVHFVPDIFGYELLNYSMDEVAGVPVLNLSASPITGRDLLLKAIEDRVLAALFLLFASPLMLLIALLIKLDSRGLVVFRQTRHGLDGRQIQVWKFRTMTVCEDGSEFCQATRNDPRVTRLGRFLRRTSLDELPQLINVLQGSMSLVGPRPHPVALNQQYRDRIGRYMARHTIKPGITGWAQVNGFRGETDTIDKMEKRIEYDLWYIQNWSVWLDIKLIIKTIFVGFFGKKAY